MVLLSIIHFVNSSHDSGRALFSLGFKDKGVRLCCFISLLGLLLTLKYEIQTYEESTPDAKSRLILLCI